MIAPHFESLATKHTKPKRIAFVKIDVEKLRDVATQYNVRAMPTFIIFKNGSPIETIQGANPPKLTQAVENAVKLAGPSTGSVFSAPGRTLGGSGVGGAKSRQSLRRPISWDLNNLINAIIGFFGLYLVSLFSVGASRTLRAHSDLVALTPHSLILTRPQSHLDITCIILLQLGPALVALPQVLEQEQRSQHQRRRSGLWLT